MSGAYSRNVPLTRSTSGRGRTSARRIVGVVRAVVVLLLLAVTLIPILWIVITAFEPNSEVLIQPVRFIPRAWTIQNIEAVVSSDGSLPYILHSLEATVGSTIAVVVLATPAAYAIAHHRFVGNAGESLSLVILAARFIPGFMLIIPLFILFRGLGLIDSVLVLIILYTVMNLPLAIWVVLPSARALPREVLEAAAVDGASSLGTFVRIGVPLLRPAIATAATLSMIFAWNEFFIALIFTQSRAQTAPLALSSFFGDQGIDWGGLAANALAVALPMIVLGVVAQRHLVRGLTAGSVK